MLRRLSTVAQTHRDIVILGAGPIGLSLAVALGRSDAVRNAYNITLLESADLDKVSLWQSPAFSNRVSSVTNISKAFLELIGAWRHLDQSRLRPVRDMQVWDGLSNARIHLDSAELLNNNTSMATMTENLNLQKGLLQTLRQDLPHVEILDKAKVMNITKSASSDGEWPIVTLDSGAQLRTRLLIGADGPQSPVRKYAGIETTGWRYDAHGVVATMHVDSGMFSNETAWQRFLPTGPIACLPLSNDRASLVWTTKPHLASRLKQLDPTVLAALINAAFQLPWSSISYLNDIVSREPMPSNEEILQAAAWRSSYDVLSPEDVPSPFSGRFPPEVVSIQEGSVASFPLRYSHANSYLGQVDKNSTNSGRTVLVGDAAHSMHPLAGQGLNTGLGDVECLANILDEAACAGMDIASLTTLREYAKSRWSANHTLMAGIDKLHKLYARQETPIIWARSLGLDIVNEVGPLKTLFMRRAGADESESPATPPAARLLDLGVTAYTTVSRLPQLFSAGVGLFRSRFSQRI